MCLLMLECGERALGGGFWLAAGIAGLLALAGFSCLGRSFFRFRAARDDGAKPPLAGSSGFGICEDGQACSAAATCGVLPTEAGPDIHLVMNTFNRIAGEIPLDGGAAADQIFALSDYLRQCLVYTGPAQVALHEEISMLQSYLRLIATFHGRDLLASVELAPGSAEVTVQAHSICLVAQVLLAGLSNGSKGRYLLPVRVQGLPTGGVDVDMALRLETRSPRMHLRSLRAELGRLAALMSRRSVFWSCRVVRDERSDIAVSLRIRPRPAH